MYSIQIDVSHFPISIGPFGIHHFCIWASLAKPHSNVSHTFNSVKCKTRKWVMLLVGTGEGAHLS